MAAICALIRLKNASFTLIRVYFNRIARDNFRENREKYVQEGNWGLPNVAPREPKSIKISELKGLTSSRKKCQIKFKNIVTELVAYSRYIWSSICVWKKCGEKWLSDR